MMRAKTPCVYILASGQNGTLYVGVTSDIFARMAQHSQKLFAGFSARYAVTQLVYYEFHETMLLAIAREKKIKKWNRQWKLRLIEEMNPGWTNLYDASSGVIEIGPFDKAT